MRRAEEGGGVESRIEEEKSGRRNGRKVEILEKRGRIRGRQRVMKEEEEEVNNGEEEERGEEDGD